MNKPLVVHGAAREEFLEAVAWYEARRVGLGAAFTAAVGEAMARVHPPQQHTPVRGPRGLRVRRVSVPGFPFRIVIADLPQVILVVAYAHTSRRPGYWRRRLEDPG